MKAVMQLIAGLVLLVAGSWLFAQDFGFDATTQLQLERQNTLMFTGAERIDGWFKAPIDANGSVFEGNGHIGVSINVDSTETTAIPTGDIDRLRVAFVFPKLTPDMTSMKFEFGRLLMTDPTGLILVHPADGFLIGFNYPGVGIQISTGYTGALLRNPSDQTIDISLSHTDEAIAADKARVFGPARLLILAILDFPDIFKQDLNISFLAQQDMNPTSSFIPEWTNTQQSATRGGALDTQYLTAKIGGPIIDTLFYDVWFTYGFGRTLSWIAADSAYEYKPINAFMTGFSLDYYVPTFLKSVLNLRFIAASGDHDYSSSIEGNTSGDANQFIPVSIAQLGTVFTPALSNLIVLQLGGSIQPIKDVNFQTGVKVFGFFRPAAVNAASAFPGIETDIFGTYRLTSDLGVSLNGGLLIPVAAGQPLQYSIQLALTLSI